MLELCGLRRSVPGFSLGPLDLEVRDGEYLVLLGPTGAGKSMALSAVVGADRPDAGAVRIGGLDATALPPERRGIGYVHQDGLLFPHRSVAWNLGFPISAWPPEERGPRLREVAENLGIAHLLDRRPATLSGGERQRAALARAMAAAPHLLVLDEPLGALDPATRRGIRREIVRLHRARRFAALHVTHDFEEAAALADRVGILLGGRLAQVGPAAEVFRAPASPEVAAFLGHRNVLRGRVVSEGAGKVLDLGAVRLALLPDAEEGEAAYTVPADSIVLSSTPLESSARNSLRGAVVEVERGISLCHVRVRTGAGPGVALDVSVTHRSVETLRLAPGREVWVSVKSTALQAL